MLSLLVSFSIYLGAGEPPLPKNNPLPELVKQLEIRGLPISYINIKQLIEEAFDNKDILLFDAVYETLLVLSYADIYADLVLKRYELLSDCDFKKAISLQVAASMANVERLAFSRYGCLFFDTAVEELSSVKLDSKNFRYRMEALICIEKISELMGFDKNTYLVRAVLTMPVNEPMTPMFFTRCIHTKLNTLPPGMAYEIYKRYKDVKEFDEFKADFAEKANPYITGEKALPPDSLEVLLKQLDEAIAANEKLICDKYGKVEPQPYQPPPPYVPRADGQMDLL